jgi:stress-induced morphogen
MLTNNDRYSHQISELLRQKYLPQHPRARIAVYRYNSASVRIRIVDPDFIRKSIVEREQMVWPVLHTLPQEVQNDISLLLLLTPSECKESLLSLEFDDPSPSRL